MRIHLRQIPAAGTLHLEGEMDPGFLELGAAGAEAVSLLRYSLDAGLSGGGIFATGSFRLTVRLVCVVTLEPFERELVVEAFAVQKDLEGRELVDLSEEIREELHLALPSHPRSEAAAEVALPAPGHRPAPPDAWGALDNIKPYSPDGSS